MSASEFLSSLEDATHGRCTLGNDLNDCSLNITPSNRPHVLTVTVAARRTAEDSRYSGYHIGDNEVIAIYSWCPRTDQVILDDIVFEATLSH